MRLSAQFFNSPNDLVFLPDGSLAMQAIYRTVGAPIA